jgi:hypothetical protein
MSFSLGMNLPYYTDLDKLNIDLEFLKTFDITEIRVSLRGYENTSQVDISKSHVEIINSKGMNAIWGVTSATTLTAANWNDFSDAVKLAAAWAEANGVYEFQIGNEEELHNDDTTLTDAQLIINLKALATDVQAIFTRGNVSYALSSGDLNDWITAGKGDIDLLGMNCYKETLVNTYWKVKISDFVNAFGKEGCYLSEFSLSAASLDDYSPDEYLQMIGVDEMVTYIKNIGLLKSCFFSMRSDIFGAFKENGTPRKLWNVLYKVNDTHTGSASQKEIRGLSHG